MTEAFEQVANNQGPQHPQLDALAVARLVNRAHGGPVIAAWNVDQLDQPWVDLFLGLAEDLPKKRARQQLVAQKVKEFEAAHPTYMKYRQRH